MSNETVETSVASKTWKVDRRRPKCQRSTSTKRVGSKDRQSRVGGIQASAMKNVGDEDQRRCLSVRWNSSRLAHPKKDSKVRDDERLMLTSAICPKIGNALVERVSSIARRFLFSLGDGVGIH